MIKFTLISIFCLQAFTANCQIRDTIRTYNYEDGPLGFSLQTKNNKTFTIMRGWFADTIKGELIEQNNRYVLTTDTTLLNKRQKVRFAEVGKCIWLEMHPFANAPLMHISTDTMQWLHLDTSELSNEIIGNYFVSTGFTGCQVQITRNRM